MLTTPTHIGANLRAEREARGLTLADIATELNVQERYLAAIEAGDRDGLPGVGYVLGYVRAYAREVGMNPDDTVDRYKADMAIPVNLRLRDTPHIIPKRTVRLPRGFVPALLVLLGAVGFALYYGLQGSDDPVITVAETAIPATPTRTDPNLITLTAETASWIEVRDNAGQTLLSAIMKPGQTLDIPSRKDPVIHVRDAGAVAISLGGTRVGLLGDQGQTLRDLSALERIKDASSDVPSGAQ